MMLTIPYRYTKDGVTIVREPGPITEDEARDIFGYFYGRAIALGMLRPDD